MSPLRSFCLERLTFLASCPRPESVISEDSDLATCNWSMIKINASNWSKIKL